MKKINILGIDLAKYNYQIFGVDKDNNEIVNKQVSRNKLIEFISKLSPCTIAMEACSGCHYLARKFEGFGHTVKILPPQYVRPFVFTNKDDEADCQAIVEASTKKKIHPVPVKTQEQQDIQGIHTLRQRYIKLKTAHSNAIRGMLFEYGIVIPKGDQVLMKKRQCILENENLSSVAKETLETLFSEYYSAVQGKAEQDKRLQKISRKNSHCKRLLEIPGIGFVTATALIAAIADASIFKNGRAMSAWLGLVPWHIGSGGKNKNLNMSKRGDQYLRYLLVHGARAVLRTCQEKKDPLSLWCNALNQRRGYNKACVALANKTARTIWAVMKTGQNYKVA